MSDPHGDWQVTTEPTFAQRMILRAVLEAAYAFASLELRSFRSAWMHAQAASAYAACAVLAKASGLSEEVLGHIDAGERANHANAD